MTQTEFAAHRGVGRSAVSNWKARSLLVFGEDDQGRVLVDVARSEARLNAKVDPTRGRPTTAQAQAPAPLLDAPVRSEPQGGGVAEVRTDLVRQQIIAAQLKNARTAGDLAPVIELERRAAELGRVARERMQSLMRSLSERFAAERDPRQIVAVGAAEIDRVFTELADQAEAGMLGVEDDGDDDMAEIVAAVEDTDETDADEALVG